MTPPALAAAAAHLPQPTDGNHLLLIAVPIDDDLLTHPDGRRRIAAKAAALAGRAYDDLDSRDLEPITA